MKTALPDLTLQEILSTKKNPLFNFTLKQFINNNCHIASHKRYRNTTNNNFIFTTKKNIDFIKLNLTIASLRAILTIITEITSKNGKIVTLLSKPINKHQIYFNKIKKETHQNFLSKWKPGILSNFKEFLKQKKKFLNNNNIYRIPNFIFFLSSENAKDLKSEILPFNIPCGILQNTTTLNANYLYTVPLVIKTPSIENLFCYCITTSILFGYNKKILFFSKKKKL